MIAAALIVKNEAEVIERCIESLAGLVDEVVVDDTGSTDDTCEILAKVCADTGLALSLWHNAWEGFATNRTELLRSLPQRTEADYYLLLDADMVVEFDDIPELTRECYLLRQFDFNLSYCNVRLVKAGLPWRYEGEMHEVIPAELQGDVGSLPEIRLRHTRVSAGNNRSPVDDIALLLREISDDPTNGRPYFYLAETYFWMGDTDSAKHYYAARAEMGGFEEERWLAEFRHAKLIDSPGAMLAVHDKRPYRAEPLMWLARFFRRAGEYGAGLMFATAKVSHGEDISIIEETAYDWGLMFEEAVCAWWTGDKARSRKLNALLLTRDLPEDVRAMVEGNLAH